MRRRPVTAVYVVQQVHSPRGDEEDVKFGAVGAIEKCGENLLFLQPPAGVN